MSNKVKMFVAIFSIITIVGNTGVFAAEANGNVEWTSPTDLQFQAVTNTDNSTLVPSTNADFQLQFRHDMQGKVLGDGVRLRSAPSEKGKILELMYKEEKVWIDQSFNNEDGWYRVTRIKTGRTGYVYPDYIQPDFD
jgi:hypothetical protein